MTNRAEKPDKEMRGQEKTVTETRQQEECEQMKLTCIHRNRHHILLHTRHHRRHSLHRHSLHTRHCHRWLVERKQYSLRLRPRLRLQKTKSLPDLPQLQWPHTLRIQRPARRQVPWLFSFPKRHWSRIYRCWNPGLFVRPLVGRARLRPGCLPQGVVARIVAPGRGSWAVVAAGRVRNLGVEDMFLVAVGPEDIVNMKGPDAHYSEVDHLRWVGAFLGLEI